jgi:hypothetical protein
MYGADQVTTLLDRDPAAHVSLDELLGVAHLLVTLYEDLPFDQGAALASRAAAHSSLDNPHDGVIELLAALRGAGAQSTGRKGDRASASGRLVRAVLRARRPRGEVPVRPGDQWPPRRAMGLDKTSAE